MVTAYDAPGARIVDEAGADLILVGDSLAMVVLGYDDTLQVTVADMAHHVGGRRPGQAAGRSSSATCRGSATTCRVEDTVRNAAALIRAGAQAVKLEGGTKRVPDGRGDRRRRDPGDGPHRPHAPVDPRHGRLQGAGQGASTRPRP